MEAFQPTFGRDVDRADGVENVVEKSVAARGAPRHSVRQHARRLDALRDTRPAGRQAALHLRRSRLVPGRISHGADIILDVFDAVKTLEAEDRGSGGLQLFGYFRAAVTGDEDQVGV